MKITLLAADSQHPNKHPFCGVLTYLNAASENPVGGANGKRVFIPLEVGVNALDTLEGMGVNVRDDLSGHNKKKKIGIIEKAWVGDPDETGAVPVHVEGYLFAADFPDEVADLQAEKDDLGFSYEAKASGEVDGSIYRVNSIIWTGATILYAKKAAYTKTSLAAEGDNMTQEQLKEMLEAMGMNLGNIEDMLAMFAEIKKALGENGAYASLSMYLSASAENATKVEELTNKVAQVEAALTASNEKVEALTNELNAAKATLSASAETDVEALVAKVREAVSVVSVEQYDALKAQADEMKTKLDELTAEAASQAQYERKSVEFPMTLSAHYKIEEKDDLQASIAEIGKREDLDPVAKLTAILEAEDRLRKAK
jgi:hypothetical protein